MLRGTGEIGLAIALGGPAVRGGPAAVRHHAEDPDDDYVVMTDPGGQRVLRGRGGLWLGGVVNEARL